MLSSNLRIQMFLITKNAAAAFDELKESLKERPQVQVLDLSLEYVDLMINLMLAQAQEMCCEKVLFEARTKT